MRIHHIQGTFMKIFSVVFLLSLSVFANSDLLDRIENEVGRDLGTKLTILASISEERNPQDIHKLCIIENDQEEITYVLNYDTSLKELSLIDELGSHHISNKQFWSLNKFSTKSISMVSFYGVDAVKGSISSVVSKKGTSITMEYLYSVSSYRKKTLTLAKVDGKWALYRSKHLKLKPIKSIFFKAKKNFLGIVTGIADIVLR